MGGGAGEALSRSAEAAFSSAMSVSLMAGAAVALAGALVALFVLPAQRRERAEIAALASAPGELEPLASLASEQGASRSLTPEPAAA